MRFLLPEASMKTALVELSVRLRRFVCGLGGHDLLLSVEPGKMWLRCTSCPYETPGWVIKDTLVRSAELNARPLVTQHASRMFDGPVRNEAHA